LQIPFLWSGICCDRGDMVLQAFPRKRGRSSRTRVADRPLQASRSPVAAWPERRMSTHSCPCRLRSGSSARPGRSRGSQAAVSCPRLETLASMGERDLASTVRLVPPVEHRGTRSGLGYREPSAICTGSDEPSSRRFRGGSTGSRGSPAAARAGHPRPPPSGAGLSSRSSIMPNSRARLEIQSQKAKATAPASAP
jgi:hypothetical protein